MQKSFIQGFDLDKTITTKDTFLPFTYELSKITKQKVRWIFCFIKNVFLLKLNFISNNEFKDRVLFLFRNTETHYFVNAMDRIRHRISFNEELKSLIKPSDIIITASPEIIPKVLFPNNKVIGLVINYERGHEFCYGHNKLTRVLDEGIDNLSSFYTDNKNEASMKVISSKFIIV